MNGCDFSDHMRALAVSTTPTLNDVSRKMPSWNSTAAHRYSLLCRRPWREVGLSCWKASRGGRPRRSERPRGSRHSWSWRSRSWRGEGGRWSSSCTPTTASFFCRSAGSGLRLDSFFHTSQLVCVRGLRACLRRPVVTTSSTQTRVWGS